MTIELTFFRRDVRLDGADPVDDKPTRYSIENIQNDYRTYFLTTRCAIRLRGSGRRQISVTLDSTCQLTTRLSMYKVKL